MIVGLLTNNTEVINNIQHLLKPEWHFHWVSESDMLNHIDMGTLVNNHQFKRSLINELQSVYGNVILSGNILLDCPTSQFISNMSGIIVAICGHASKLSGQYFNQVDIDAQLIQRVKSYNLPQVCWWDYSKLNTIIPEQYVNQVEKEVKAVSSVNLGDTIKRAMQRMGLEDTEDIISEMEPNIPKIVNDPIQELPVESEEGVDSDTNNSEVIDKNAVYLKIKDGNMALFIPNDMLLKLPIKHISGAYWAELAFRAPDLGNTQLQQLYITSEIEKTKPTQKESDSWVDDLLEKTKPQLDALFPDATPSHSEEPSSEKKVDPVVMDEIKPEMNNDLQRLMNEKDKLTQLMKEARESGNLDTEKELRKQRRKVREHINKLKQVNNNGEGA